MNDRRSGPGTRLPAVRLVAALLTMAGALTVAGGAARAAAPVAAQGSASPVSVEEAVAAYVERDAAVRKARTDYETARINYQKATGVAAAPRFDVSGSAEWGVPPGGNLGGSQGATAGDLTLQWSPVDPLALSGTVHVTNRQEASKGTTPATSSTQAEKSTASFQATWTLWPPSGASERSLQALSASVTLQDATSALREAESAAAARARLLYVQVQAAAARVSVRQSALRSAEEALDRARTRQAAGLAGPDVVAQARQAAQQAAAALQKEVASLASLEQSLGFPASRLPALPTGDALVAAARQAAAAALSPAGFPGGQFPVGPPDGRGLATSVRPLPDGLVDAALRRAPEVTLAKARLDLAVRQQRAVEARWGTVSLSGGVRAPIETSSGGSGPIGEGTWFAGVSAGLSLLDGGARRLDVEKARQAVDDARAALADAERTVANDVAGRWQSVASAALNLHAALASMDQAELAWRTAQARAQAGAASQTEVDEARRTLDLAALDVIEGAATLRHETEQFVARLEGVAGGIAAGNDGASAAGN